MRKFLSLVLLMALMFPFAARADEVIIGTAMDAAYTHPFALDYKNSWSEAIYFEEEIGMSGMITEISFYCTNPQSRSCQDLRIYMGVSDKRSQTSTSWLPESELTLVYQGPSDLMLGSQEGWQTFELDEPFIYEGYDNLIVAVGRISNNYTFSQKWAYTWTNNAVLYRQNDYNTAYGQHPGNGSGNQSSKRANIKLEMSPMDGFCGKVKSIVIDEYTSNTATVSIVPRDGQVAWDYFIATSDVTPDEFTVPTAANVADTTYTFTGLLGATEYNVWVRGNCGDNVSGWKSKGLFTFPNWEGDGTEENPYLFYTVKDILDMNQLMKRGWSTEGVHFSQMNNIEGLNVAICPSGTSFKGVWDGNGYSVELNLSGRGYQGMFASMSPGAVVRNVTTTGRIISNDQYNGGITGYMYGDAIIENCVNYATMQSSSGCTAGIAGYVNSNSLIENCVNYGDIVGYGNWHGGIAGYMNNTAYLKGCTNYGTVQGWQYTGGISSECVNYSTIIDCANIGDVDAGSAYIGGITGHVNKSQIYNSYNVGDVKGSHNTGGITGYLQSNDTIHGIIENVYNGGTVVGTNGWLTNTGSILGYNPSGTMRHAYYLEGTHKLAYGTSCNTTRLFDAISFAAGTAENVFVLSEEHFGTTDLLIALNAYEVYGENEWKKDIYGNNKNMPTFNVGNAPGLEVYPSTISMGFRPIGAEMAPVKVTLTNTSSTAVNISNFEFESSFFMMDNNSDNPELPFTLEARESVDVYITTNANAEVEEGFIEEQFVVVWGQRGVTLVDITARAYNPTAPDVVEMPGTIASFPASVAQVTDDIKANYQLPGGGAAGADAVYKLTITNDILLNAEVNGDNPKVAVYTEDLYGKLYPSTDNNYVGPVVNETSGPQFYFNQAQFVTHAGEGLNGADNSLCGQYMGWGVDQRYNYSMADDFYSDEDIVINEVEFYAYQLNALTTSTMTGLFIQIYDANPKEGGQVIWGDMETNLLTHSSWTGAYRVSPGFELDPDCPIMKLVATGLNIELPAGTYWIEYSALGNANFGTAYGIPRTVWGETTTGNGLVYDGYNDVWSEMYDSGYAQGVPMILRTGFSQRGGEMAKSAELPKATDNAIVEAHRSNSTVDMTDRLRSGALSTGGTNPIANMTMIPGTYYLVASSTSSEFTLNVNTETIPVPEQPSALYPADGAKEINAPIALKWNFGRYTTEYQVLFGTTYPPTEVIQDWSKELVNTFNIFELKDNTNYFWQVNQRNASGTTQGPVWGFVTSLDVPQNVAVETSKIYAGEDAILSWTSVPSDRSYRGYNVYQNGVKVNKSLITESTYAVEGLTYNMTPGYSFTVTAVYDEGESAFSNSVQVYVTDNGTFGGFVYELDGVTPIADVAMMVIGRDEHNKQHLYEYVTDASGYYGGEILAGSYKVLASKEGYQKGSYYDEEAQSEHFVVNFDEMTENINVVLTEVYNPICEVKAEETEDSNVNVYWSWDRIIPESLVADFETGDFSQAEFNNEVSDYPWAITETAYEGSYAIKSTCENVDNGVSTIEATIEVPFDGQVSFYHKVSSESGWDIAYFSIDGEVKKSVSGEIDWKYVEVPVTAGLHTYSWSYVKDGSVQNGDDAYYVDNIVFYQEIPPFEGGWLYYDDGTYASSIGLGSASPMSWGISFPNAEAYAGFTLTKVSVFDASPDYAGTYTANIYLGGTTAPETLVASQSVTLTGIADFVELELETPVTIDGTQPLWITFYTADITYPAAGCTYVGDANSDWLSLDGSLWEHCVDYSLNYSWMIRGYLENAKGETRKLSRASDAPKFEHGVSTGEFVAKAAAQPISVGVPSNETMANNEMTREMKYYKVYRANNLNNEYTVETVQLVGDNVLDTFLLDTEWSSLETGVYKWGVAAVYEGNRKANERTIELDKDFVAYEDATLPCNAEVEIANIDGTMFRGAKAYANSIYSINMPVGYLSLDMEKPLEAVTINTSVVNRGGEYFDGMFYGYSTDHKYYHIIPETGEIVAEKSVGIYMTEMAYDYSTSTMYGIYSGDLYTISIETGEATFIGELGQTIMAFGIDLQGNAYGIALGYGDLYSINLYDATCEYIGSTNMGCNYVQSAAFDHNDGTFYWFQCFSTDDMGLYKVDVTTAEAQMISLNTGEITSFFIPYEEGDPTYPFQSFNESPIVWSNTIDKNMVTSVSISAATNSGDTAENTVVTFKNLSEPEMGYDVEITLDETGYYEWTEFRKGVYELTVNKSGFSSDAMAEVVEIWDVTSIEVQLTELIDPVAGLYVSPTGWAMWLESGNSVIGDEFEYSFEGSPEGWSFIDANEDGHTWYHNSVSTQHGVTSIASHIGSGHMYSESFCNIIATPIAPDDYLVSPVKAYIGSSSVFSFWACAQDEFYAAEHFGVAVSTAGNTSAADFTTIAEWTLTAKSGAKAERDNSGKGEGSWYQFSVDLKDYAGQEVWLAIRHFNSFDQYVILIDDVTLQNTRDAKSVGFYQISLNGVPEDDVTVPYYQHENLIIGEQYTTAVTTYYTTGISEENTYTWTYAGCNQYPGVTEFTGEYSNGNVALNWTLPTSGNNGNDDDDDDDEPVAMSWDFEDGLDGWTTIDADGDEIAWYHNVEYGVTGDGAYGNNNSTGFVFSQSYDNWIGPLNPDNYLVSPEKIAVTAGTKISFYACAQDESYAAEHFGVAVSAAGNTSASDFTTISEWTIGAKGTGTRNMRQSSWTQYEADLSAYAGQEVYVAIRHFNCTDQYFLDVDDIAITSSKETREGTWAYYDDGINVDGIGGPASFSWAIKLRADDIANLGALTKVAAYDRLSTSGTFDICLGGDNEPGASVLNQSYTFTGINDFVEIDLTEAIDPAGQNVWIVFNTDDGVNYPAAECANTGDPDGRWIYLSGSGWFDVTEAGLDATWMLRGYFDTEAGNGNNEGGESIAEILGVMLYRDGELLTPQPITETSYTETVEDNNEYEYDVRVVYGGVKDSTYYAMSCPETVTIDAVMACDAPEDLYGEATFNADGTFGATLTWPYSVPTSEWLYYDDGNFVDGIGGPATFTWGIMFPANTLEAYAGTFMTKVALYDYVASSGDINIYYGGTSAPGTLVHSQAYSVSGTGSIVEFELTSALPIDETQNVWVTFTTSQGASYPAAVSNDCGDANSRWISLDGATWEDLAGYGLVYSWIMRAYVTNEAKTEVSELTPITDYEYTIGEGEFAKAGAKASTLDHYNVYRGTSSNNFELVGETTEGTYFDELSEEGTYYYQVTAVYVSGNDECESDPANAYDTDEDYVVVNVVSINENGVEGMMVYPNPTTDKVTIEAEAMTRITITNALGQVIYDQEVNSDNKVLDMSQYEGGVYMVRITTENGVAVERLTVVR